MNNWSDNDIICLIKIQALYRMHVIRKKQLPIILQQVFNYLQKCNIVLSKNNIDGRCNSINDEEIIITLLLDKFTNKIIIPKKRSWYDIAIYDYFSESYLPINIKTSTITTSDNIGNLSLCVESYTSYKLDIYKFYKNGELNKILQDELNNKRYNYNYNKDYYFIIVNKTNTNEIIINSINKLTKLTPNHFPNQIVKREIGLVVTKCNW